MPIGVRDIFVVNLIIKVIFPLYVWTKEHIEAHFLKPCIYWVWRVFYIHLAAKVRRIQPLYVTYEYITRSREELGKYLDQGKILLMDCQKNRNVL